MSDPEAMKLAELVEAGSWRAKQDKEGRWQVYGPPHPDGGDYAAITAGYMTQADAKAMALAPALARALITARQALESESVDLARKALSEIAALEEGVMNADRTEHSDRTPA